MLSPFRILASVAILGPLVLMWSYWHEARSLGWDWISEKGRAMYVEAGKTLITASGVAVAIVVSALGGRFSPPIWMVQRSVVALIICIVSSFLTILALNRGYERAASRSEEQEEGQLTRLELILILAPAYAALVSFLLGFLYLGRIAFHM